MLRVWLIEFANDNKVQIALLLVLVDFIFGVAAAFKMGTFKMSYVADFVKNDVLFKLLPYFALYSLALVQGSTDLLIPGLDFGAIAGATYAVLIAAWVGSILSSLVALGVPVPLPKAFTGPEKTVAPNTAPAVPGA